MPQFKSGSAFINFCESVRSHYRYVHQPDVGDFLSALVETASSRVKSIPADSRFWRAQLGTDSEERTIELSDVMFVYDEDVPYSAQRMVPLRNSAHEGRVNPKGMPCLYLATDKDTAMSEVRPWLGANISLATLRTERELHVVDCSRHHDFKITRDLVFEDHPPEKAAEVVWAQIDRAFSQPMREDLGTAGYVPTQIVAEALRQKAFDGVEYQSKLGPGHNLALFDLNSATVLDVTLCRATSVKFEFK